MALITGRQTYSFRDAKGNVAKCSLVFTWDSAHPADLATLGSSLHPLVAALSNAQLIRDAGAVFEPSDPGYGSQATFGSAEDKAVLTFTTGSGSLHRMSIPAPKAAIFYTDAETVNAVQADVAALIAEIITGEGTAVVTDVDGKAITGMVGGQRTRRPNQRKVNIFTLAPSESIPAE